MRKARLSSGFVRRFSVAGGGWTGGCRLSGESEDVKGPGVIDTVARLIDPVSLALVAGGSIAVAALRSTRGDVARALRAAGPLVRRRPERDEARARRSARLVEQIAEAKGIACADHAKGECAFVRKAALRLVDTSSPAAFAEWANEELRARHDRHAAAAAVWRAAADAAPNMGMIGTVLGLIAMFASMDDPARMGPAMALAMLTTFYGLVLGTLLFGSVAARLERLVRGGAALAGRDPDPARKAGPRRKPGRRALAQAPRPGGRVKPLALPRWTVSFADLALLLLGFLSCCRPATDARPRPARGRRSRARPSPGRCWTKRPAPCSSPARLGSPPPPGFGSTIWPVPLGHGR
jgi:chemotaxis protein MotA